jgi:Arc/MetJ-type ribon-helix-helix transcriptional regulator
LAASSSARLARRVEPKKLVHLRLPVSILGQVDALVGGAAVFENRSAALRRLIVAGLSRGVSRGAESLR